MTTSTPHFSLKNYKRTAGEKQFAAFTTAMSFVGTIPKLGKTFLRATKGIDKTCYAFVKKLVKTGGDPKKMAPLIHAFYVKDIVRSEILAGVAATTLNLPVLLERAEGHVEDGIISESFYTAQCDALAELHKLASQK